MPVRSIATRTVCLLLVFALALAVFACAPAMQQEASWEKDALALLEQAEALSAKKQYEQASKTAEAFLSTYPKSRYADRGLMFLGELRLSLRDYSRASHYYAAILENHPSSPLFGEAKYKLGLCAFELKNYDLAIPNLEDRTRINEPSKLRRIAEMLAAAYLAKKNHPAALREFAFLAENGQENQRPAYRDRVRSIVDKDLSEDELRSIAAGSAYPADQALLKLAALLFDQRKYPEAIAAGKDLLIRFPANSERTRAEMIVSEATAKLTAPRYSIGVLVPQTGQAAFFGDRVLKGIRLAVLAYNIKDAENRVELVVRDTEGSADKAASAFAELKAQNVVAVIGPLLTKEVEAVAPALAKAQVPVFTPTASGSGLTDLSPWIFRNALTNGMQASTAAQYALRSNYKKFAIFHPDDPYGRDLARQFIKDMGRNAEIIASIGYPPEANDFGPYIKRLIEIEFRSQKIAIPEDDQERKRLFQYYVPTFDAVYLPGYAEKVGLLIPQLAFYNITGKPLIGSNNWHSPDLIERAGSHVEGAVFVDGFYPESQDPAIKTVIEAYRTAYQEEPDVLAAQAYDAAMLILSLLKERRDTPAAIKEGLLATKNFAGISGTASFQGSGEAQKQLFLIRIENGKFVQVKE